MRREQGKAKLLGLLLAMALLLQVATLAGCERVDQLSDQVRDRFSDGAPEVAGERRAGQTLTVPLQVIERQGSVLALVPVYIDGEGPFAFALDTGASLSLIDRELVDRLGLQEVGRTGEVTGVAGMTEATLIRVDRWRVGGVELPATTAITLDMPDPNNQTGLQGLLGSDMLSQFGAITVDYEARELILRSRQ